MSLTRFLAVLFALSVVGVVSSAYTGASSTLTRRFDELTGIEFHHAPKARSIYPGLSNAERLKRGLPLNPPRRRSPDAPSSPQTSQIPTRGRVQVFDVTSGSPLGYISKNPDGSQIAGLSSSVDDAMIFQYDSSAPGPYNFAMVNPTGAFTSWPLLGNIEGPSSTSASLAPGSYNYCFFAGTNATPAGSTPVAQGSSYTSNLPAETVVWNVAGSGDISIQWVNPDGSKPSTFVMYASGSNFISITGDVALYKAAFGSNRAQVSLKWVAA
ncbi:hypothetical protein CPB83DRAFT_859220 [Crepidotus variabilis]|uniref:Uncharacterized protein n=1 Tax=Crepidotus variabilis TaxID=179855 RepID=A0A9P6EAT5_9AGAR|nr:hypothetical protein CPB83DRAFT_859220 [Crepidotus variabilis]